MADPNAAAERLMNLGETLLDTGDAAGARECCLRALEIDQRCIGAHVTLGNVLVSEERFEEAIECYRTAIRLDPQCPAARPNIGAALYALGRHAEALAAFEETLRFEPCNPLAVQMVAALGGAVVQSAPREYVRGLFDGYAATFDQHLVNELNYRTPALIANLVHDLRQVAPRSLDVLDLGCGTGLAGAAISPFARRIVGVDLAPKMLEVAQRKGIYERLECNDLLEMLAGEQSATFDLVLATDVFIYLGRLDSVVDEVRRVLRPGGMFAFSVERLDASDAAVPSDVDFRVTAKGRYAHSAEYLRRLSIQAGFAVDRQVDSRLRMDQGRPITGWLAVWSASRRA